MTMLRVVPQEDWEIVSKYLIDEGGVVLVPQYVAEELATLGIEVKDDDVDYNFGGNADLWVDVMYSNSYSRKILFPKPDEEDDCW